MCVYISLLIAAKPFLFHHNSEESTMYELPIREVLKAVYSIRMLRRHIKPQGGVTDVLLRAADKMEHHLYTWRQDLFAFKVSYFQDRGEIVPVPYAVAFYPERFEHITTFELKPEQVQAIEDHLINLIDEYTETRMESGWGHEDEDVIQTLQAFHTTISS